MLTNHGDAKPARPSALSRGELVPVFLAQPHLPDDFAAELSVKALDYGGFNLMVADERCLWYVSNRADPFARALTPGVYGLGNQLLDSPSPKLLRLRRRFEAWLRDADACGADDLFGMLADTEPALAGSDVDGPTTASPDLLQALSAPFVKHPSFGTRCSTVVLATETGSLLVAERSFDAAGRVAGEVSLRI